MDDIVLDAPDALRSTGVDTPGAPRPAGVESTGRVETAEWDRRRNRGHDE
jgi:hypothetical protein